MGDLREFILLSLLRKHSTTRPGTAQHSTAQHSTTQLSTAQHSSAQHSQPAQAAKQVRADQSATTQADRVDSSQHVVEAFMQLAVFSKRSKISKYPRPTKIYNHSQSRLAVMLPATLLLLSFLFRPCMRRPDCFRGPWSSWNLQVASLQLKTRPSLSASVVRIWFN